MCIKARMLLCARRQNKKAMMWVWFGITVALIITEVATIELVAVWFALSSLVTGIVAGCAPSLSIVWQIVIFVSASVVLLFATRPLVKRLMRKKKGTETNLDLLLGSKALVLEDIRNDYGTGTVKINGIVWTARSADGTDIEKDSFVIIKEIQGNKVLVEKEKKE